MENHKKDKNDTQEVIDFSIKDFIKICLGNWYWFLLSIAVAVGIGLFYIYYQQPVYERSEQILVTDNDSGGGIGDITEAFSSLGLFSNNTNVNNELISLTSPAVMYQVADKLRLDYNYITKDGIRNKTLYGNSLPFVVKLPEIDPQGALSFRFSVSPDGSKKLWKFVTYKDGKKIKVNEEINVPPLSADEIITPIGKIIISPNPIYNGEPLEEPIEIRFSKMPMQTTVEIYGEKLLGDLVDQDADVIGLSIKDVSVQRAVDILNEVLNVYNQDWIDDKNRMAVATSAFIDERLRLIQKELGEVDMSIAEYQKKIGTPDLLTTAGIKMEKEAGIDQELIQLNNQLSVAEFMQDYITKNVDNSSIIPVNIGVDSKEIASQIVAYNDLLMARNNILSNSSATNPLVENYDRQLQDIRLSILKGVDNEIGKLKTLVSNMNREQSKIGGQMASASVDALPLLSEERQQKVKEGLYLFLLQKREENELSQKFSADNTRIISPPMGSLDPVSPRKGLIIVVAFLIGLGSPLAAMYISESSNTKVRSRKDLENVSMPFAGEIPHVGKKTKLKIDSDRFGKFARSKKEEKPPLSVVEEGKRDVVNEAFRVIRSNIDFMGGKNKDHQVIMLTSFNPGSGKSFIAYNLGLSFAIKGKKVLLIDCDLRHGSSSMYIGMPQKGITDYLTETTDNWEHLIVKSSANPNLSILPIGKMPPNPAELLENGRLEELVKEAKGEYDYVLLDCPPVNIVVDTHIVGQYADRTLFVVRAGLLEKNALKELNEFYAEKRFKNMSLILNGTEAAHSRYYTYGNYQNLN